MTESISAALELEGPYVRLEQLLALRHVPLGTLRRNQLAHSTRGGARQSRHRGRGIDFSEVRLYQPGDDVRSIDWRVTARKARPHTKVFREERERPTLIVVDQSQTMFFGSIRRLKSVLAAEAAALLAWQGLALGERVGGIVVGNHDEHVFRPHRSTRGVVRLLGRIALTNAELNRTSQRDSGRLATALRHASRVAHRGFRVFVITDFSDFDDEQQRLMLHLGRGNDLSVLLTVDPLDRDLPPADRYAITDGQRRSQLDSANSALRQRYHRRYDERIERVRGSCMSAGIRFALLETSDDVAPRIAEHGV